MTPHDHTTFVAGCYRCELGRDEAEASREAEQAHFWLTAMSCKTGATVLAGKIGKAIATDKSQQREDLIASALRQARRIVEGLEELDA